MVNGDGQDGRRERLLDRANQDEPLVDTIVLDTLAQMDLPLRGAIRQNVLDRTRAQLKQRRTVSSVAERVAQNAVAPVNNAVQTEAEDRAKQRAKQGIEKMVNRRDGE